VSTSGLNPASLVEDSFSIDSGWVEIVDIIAAGFCIVIKIHGRAVN
jgi:hypothetical protein